MSDSEPDRGGGLLTGLILGALGGVVVAMFVTPQTGEGTRELVQRGRSIVDSARSRIESAISEGREAAERQRTELEERA